MPQMEDFNILRWWKTNAHRYPILARVATNILAILITIVTSDQLLALVVEYHNKLHSSTFEVLMCCQSWLQAYNGIMSLFYILIILYN